MEAGPPRSTDPHGPSGSPLPIPDTALIGRELQIARLRAMVDLPGLVTITGEGGVGKTRLVLEVAQRQDRPVVFVPLADLDRTGATLAIRRVCAPLLLSRFDAATGTLREASPATAPSAPPGEPGLLILDSVEQVGQISDLIAEIRTTVPAMTIVVTSRSRLGLSNERVLHLIGLPTGPDGAAVELFLTRSRAVGADTTWMDDQRPAVTALCRALDGLPLAIELAAARTRMMSPAALLAQVHSPDHRRMLTLLAKGPADLPKRQLSMRASLAWSHQLLTPTDQVLFRRLGIFPGSFSLDAAEAAGGSTTPDRRPGADPVFHGGDSDDVLDGIAEMVDLHLVEPVDAAGDPERVRFVMSDVARAFAGELLAASGEGPEVQTRLLRWCRDLVAQGERGLASTDEQLWLDRLDQEMPIIRQCLAQCAAEGMGLIGLELAVRLGRYWCLRGSTTEGMRWCRVFLDATEPEPDFPAGPAAHSSTGGADSQADFQADFQADPQAGDHPRPAPGRAALDRARTLALAWWSRLAIGDGDPVQINAHLRSMRRVRPAAIEAAGTFEWLNWTDNLILSLLAVGQPGECGDMIADGLRAAEDQRDPYWTCVFLLHRALWRWTSVGQREDQLALRWAEMAAMAATDNGLFRVAARAVALTGMNLMARRDWTAARESMTQSLDGLRRGGDTRSYAVSLNCLGAIMIELDRPQEAARYLVEAIAEARRSDDRLGEIGAAWAVSFLACRLGRHADIAIAHDAVTDHLGLLERLLPATLLHDYRLAAAGSEPGVSPGPDVGCDTPAWSWLRGWAMGIAVEVAALPAAPAPPPIDAAPPSGSQSGSQSESPAALPAAVPEPPRATPALAAAPAAAGAATRDRLHELTARELEILAAIASGRTNAQIATDFFLSTKTVMHHSVSIYRKLEVRGRAEAVALAYRTGLLQTPVG